MEERRSDEFLEPRVDETLPLLSGGYNRAVEQNSSLGEDLKRARMDRGHSLEDASKVLRIRLAYLESLESGEFDELPGLTYAIGFLKSYSSYLGLDSEEMVERLKHGSDGAIAKPDLSFHTPNREISRPRPILILIVLVLAGIAYGGWHLYSTQGQIANELVTDVSTTLTEVAGFSKDDEVMVAIASGSGNSVEVNAEERIESSEIISDSLYGDEGVLSPEYEENVQNVNNSDSNSELIINSNQMPNDTGVVSDTNVGLSQASVESKDIVDESNSSLKSIPSETRVSNDSSALNSMDSAVTEGIDDTIDNDETKIYGVENTNARIIITATEDSWVQIQGPKKELILTRILRNGDIFQVPNRAGLKMVTGNAGALEIRVDGTLIEPIGPIGVVRRDVILNPDQLLVTSGVDY